MNGRPGLAAQARLLLRGASRATLATLGRDGGAPHASLVLVACLPDATPILLLSQLAEHTKNLLADGRVSLLVDGTAGLEDPLTGPRLTVNGRLAASPNAAARARFLARHPGAAAYAGFGDFAFHELRPDRAHLVAGFGRIDWIDDLLLPAPPALAAAEGGIVAHMNADHADALQLYANVLLGRPGTDWTMTGCDAEGCDLMRPGEWLRLPFDTPVADADGARRELVALVRRARSA